MRVVLIGLCLLFSIQMKAQETIGGIVGKLTDKEMNDEPLAFASVVIQGTTKGTTTDFDGLYELPNLEPGTYNLSFSFLGYQTIDLPNIEVVAGKVTTINVPMSASEGVSLDEVVVTTVVRKDSEVALLLDQKKAVEIKESIGAQQLAKIGVTDVATATTKISGISSSEASGDIYVRGLGDRYLSTTLNGLPVPSDDVEKKNIDLGLFTTRVIQNVSVSKTYSVQSSADQSSGTVNISSRELTGNNEFSIGIQGGINTNVAQNGVFNNFKVSPNSKNSTLGFYKQDNSSLLGQITQQGWNTVQQESPIDYTYSLVAGKKITEKFSAFLSASQSRNFDYGQGVFREYTSNAIRDTLTDATNYNKNTTSSGLLDLTYYINEKNKLKSSTFFINTLSEQIFEGGRNGEGTIFEETNRPEGLFQFVRDQNTKQTRILVTQLLGTHQLGDKNTFMWAGGYNLVNADEPNRIRNEVNFDPDSDFVQLGRNGGFQQRKSSQEIEDKEYNGYLKDILRVIEEDNKSFKIELGANYRNKKRDFSSEFVGVEEVTTNAINPPSIDNLGSIFQQSNFDNGLLTINQLGMNANGERKDIYSGELDSKAAFADFNIGLKKLNVNIGLRYQSDNISVNYDVGNLLEREGSVNKTYNNLYPSLNLKYSVNDKNAFRAAVSRTITLPEFKEISPFGYVSQTGQVTAGNVDLEASINYNYDLKWEFFPTNGQLVSLSAFYKEINDPINKVQRRGSAGIFSYFNSGDKAEIFGLEAETKVDLVKPGPMDENGTASGFGLNLLLNASRIWHQQDLKEIRDGDGNLLSTFRYNGLTETELQGASDWIFNASLNFTTASKNPLDVSLTANYASDKIFALGTPQDQSQSDVFYNDAIIEKGFMVLDGVVSKDINEHWSLRLRGRNLLNPEIKRTQLVKPSTTNIETERTVRSYSLGTQLSLGLSYTF